MLTSYLKGPLRANTSHLRMMQNGALAAWIEPRFGIPVLLTSCQKGLQKCPGNRSPMCSLCSLTSLFEVFCLEPSKSWFQTTSRQNAVSWVHGTFAEINYYPDEGEGGEVGNISSKPCTNVGSASRKYILLSVSLAENALSARSDTLGTALSFGIGIKYTIFWNISISLEQ